MPQHVFNPVGPAAQRLATLGTLVLVTFAVVTVVMWILIFWLGMRRTGTLADHAPWDAANEIEKRWIWFGGIVIPVVILCVMFVAGLRVMSAFPLDGRAADREAEGEPSIRIVGHQWWWEVHYLDPHVSREAVTANEIHIPAGQPVDIQLEARDVIHSFWVPQLHGKVDLVPGIVNRIRIEADRPGLYRGECAEYCGPQHAKMVLLVSADTPKDYGAWLERQLSPAAPPPDRSAEFGEQLFLTHQCVLCHTIRGTDAHGLVGPDLTHVGSRTGIAANALPNNTANLEAWVTHAQSLKPDAQMPNVTAFHGDELRALVAYLRALK